MTSLLVSVRSAAEAQIALDGGVDLIDIKEPLRGSLGAAEPTVWEEIQRVVGGRAPVSIALGEALDDDVRRRASRAHGFRFAKVGLAGCAALRDWREPWEAVLRELPFGVGAVAVAYADAQAAGAPRPEEIVAAAGELGCQGFLIDTWDKSRGSLNDHLSLAQLADLCLQARQSHLLIALAGSLRIGHLAAILKLAPDYLAVRGAVCRGDRSAVIDEGLVAVWRTALSCARDDGPLVAREITPLLDFCRCDFDTTLGSRGLPPP